MEKTDPCACKSLKKRRNYDRGRKSTGRISVSGKRERTAEREREKPGYEYNQLRPSQNDERVKFLKRELKKTGENLRIEQPFHCDFWKRVTLGENFFANYNFTVLAGNEISFGDNVMIGPNCGIYAAGHAFDVKRRRDGLEYALPVHIGNDVWIGGHVSIVSGVSIGNGSIIGAGSVVINDIPENVIAAGNPCKVIRKIESEDDRKYLMTEV